MRVDYCQAAITAGDLRAIVSVMKVITDLEHR